MIEANGKQILTDVYDIVLELGKQLEANGIKRFYKTIRTRNNIMTCCPFHKEGQERKPSFGILESDGTCHCFACGWTGSLAEMISNCFGYNDLGRFGNKWLIQHFVTAEFGERNLDIDVSRDKKKKEVSYVSEEELDKYRYTHPYWAKRKITNPDIIELFDLGYDKDTDCITFPVRDVNGRCLFVARRSTKTKYFHYPEGVEKPLYGLYEYITDVKQTVSEFRASRRNGKTLFLQKANEIIVCESMLDALTAWQYGRYAVAMNGLGSEYQYKQLREIPCRKLILATDMDEKGLEARERIRKNVPNKLITEYRWDLKVAKDVNDMTEDYFNNLVEFM